MQKIQKQEYTTEFKEPAFKYVKVRELIGLVTKDLGLAEQTLHN